MPKTKKFDYLEVYRYAKEFGVKETCEAFGLSESRVRNCITIGDDFAREKPLEKNAKTLDKFSPRELMMELANRGYRGNLTYTQTINISNF